MIRIFLQSFFKKLPAFYGIGFPIFTGFPAYFIYILPDLLLTEGEELVNGDLEITGQGGNQGDIGKGNARLP